MDVRLPNGVVLRGVPEGTSQEDIQRKAIESGLATPEDFGQSSGFNAQEFAQREIVPMLPEIGGMTGALAGAATGAAAGTLALPGIGTLAGGALGLFGGAVGAFSGAGIGETLRQYFEDEDPDVLQAVGVASREGGIDLVGGKAFDIFKGAKDLTLKAIGYGRRDVSQMTILRELQEKLTKDYGSTLRGSQVDPNASIVAGLESVTEEAIGTRGALEAIALAQQKYLDDQVEGLVSVGGKLKDDSLGALIKNLVENSRTASADAFGEAFKELSEKGAKVRVSLQGPRNRAQVWRQTKMEGLTKRMQQAIDRGAKIPFTSSDIQRAVDDILKLSPNTSFDNAFNKLKDLKGRLTALKGDPATANDPAVAELTGIVKGFEESLLTSARKSDPALADTYEKLMKEYNKTQNILYSDVATKILREGNPELVGRTLAATGTTTPIKELRKIIAEAKKLGVKQGGDVLKGVRKGFLAKHLSAAEGQALNTLSNLKNKLADPDFSRTFNELVPPEEKKRIFRLLEEAEILNRGVGGEFSLAVRSSQLAGAQGVAVGGGNAGLIANTVKLLTPNFIARVSSDPKRAQAMLGLLKTATRYVNVPESMPPEVKRAFALRLAKFMGEGAMEADSAQADAEMAPLRQELEALRNSM